MVKKTSSACELIDQKKNEERTNNAFGLKAFLIIWIFKVLKMIFNEIKTHIKCRRIIYSSGLNMI